MASKELNELRSLVLSRQADVTRKIDRYSTKGVILTGSNFDPRANEERVSRMTRKQLNELNKNLNSFMSRSNQFVGDFKGAPIHISVWREFKKTEARYNKRLAESYGNIKDIFIAPMNKTVDTRLKEITPNFPHMKDSAVNAPYEPSNIEPGQIAGKNGMANMIAHLAKKADKGYSQKELNRAKVEFQQMIDIIDNNEIKTMFKALTDQQAHLLWHYTNFASRLSVMYETKARLKRAKKSLSADSSKFDQSSKGAVRLLEWVKTVRIGE